jgi:hypothetical protein
MFKNLEQKHYNKGINLKIKILIQNLNHMLDSIMIF